MKEISKFKIFILSLTDFSDAIFTGIIASYLMYYFLPSDNSGIITMLPRATASFAIVKAIGTFFDFFIDVFLSKYLDKRKSGKNGRRIPVMRNSLIALVLSTSLIFFIPFEQGNIGNVIWLGFFLMLYYLSFSLYYVSYYALEQELVPAGKKRNYTYMVSAITYFFGTIVVIVIPGIKDILVNFNFSVMSAWQLTIVGVSLVAGFVAWLPLKIVKENEYFTAQEYHVSTTQTIKELFSIKQFKGMFLAFFVINILTFVIDSLDLYYITIIFSLPEEVFVTAQSIYYLIATITIFLAVFMANRTSIRTQLLIASVFCCLAFVNILLSPFLLQFISGTALMIIYYACLVYPYASFAVFPYVIFADIAEYDRRENNKYRSGFHCALQNFSFKFSQSFAFIFMPFVIGIGATPGSNVSKLGLYGSAIICLIFSVIIFWIFIKYKDMDLSYKQSKIS